MFQKNLEAIRLTNPTLAAKLEKMDLSKISDIEVIEAESKDLIISYKNTSLHSTLDPVREAKTAWLRTVNTDLRKNDIQLIFGMGLGYLFKRAFVSAESKVFVLEPFIDVMRFVLEYVDLSQELSDKRVFITDNAEDLFQKLRSEFLSGDRIEFLFLNSYAALAQDVLINLTHKVVEICESKSMDQNTIFNQCKFWTKNTILNMPYFPESRPVGFFEGIFSGKTALIVSAGPSLADNIQKIKQNRNKFIIIAVAPTLKLLIEAGITPDFATFADPNYLEKHISGIEDKLENVNLVVNSRAENCVLDAEFRHKIIYFSETDALARWYQENTTDKVGLYKSGGTISILSYYFAKLLGCNPIAFVGLDLAFIDNKVNARGKEPVLRTDGRIEVDYLLFKRPMLVKSYKGEMIPSRDDYALFIRHFNEIFTTENNPARVINTATSGAYIEGVEYMEFDELLNILNKQNVDINEVLSSRFDDTKDEWNELNNKIYKELKLKKEYVSNLDKVAVNVFEELKEIKDLLDQPESKLEIIQAKIDSIKSSMADVRKEVVSDVFISTYLQSEIWQYAQQYKTNPLPRFEDLKFNMTLEYDLFKMVCWATENINKWLEEALQRYESRLPALTS